MAAISSPAAIGHDWSSACPSENKIPADWLSDNTDPDTSDAAVVQGKQGFLSAYPYSVLSNSTGSSDTMYYKDPKSSTNIATYNKLPFVQHFNRNYIKDGFSHNESYQTYLNNERYQTHQNFITSTYSWIPIRRQPIIMYPIVRIPQYTLG